MNKGIKAGTVLLAKDWHPERSGGGSGVAIVMKELDGTFILIEWIASVCNPFAPHDLAAVAHIHDQYDIIDESLREQYIPKDWKPSNSLSQFFSTTN